MCIVCITNNINRNVYMYLNTRKFSTTGYARVYRARARRNGYRVFISVYILLFLYVVHLAFQVFCESWILTFHLILKLGDERVIFHLAHIRLRILHMLNTAKSLFTKA